MVVFLDGMSHYSASELDKKWTSVSSTDVTWDVLAEGRTDGCIKRTSTGNGNPCGRLTFTPLFTQDDVWTPTASGVFGCALKVDDLTRLTPGVASLTSFDLDGAFFTLYNGSRALFAVSLNQDGTFSAYRKVVGLPVLLGTTVQALNDDEWAYVQIRWFLSTGNDGEIVIKVNGNTVMTFTGRTCPDATDMFPFGATGAEWTSINPMGQASEPSPFLVMRMCDLYLCDRVAPNDDFLGDISIAYIKPDGVGAASGWTPSAGANWECVDEVPPNDETDYVETTTPATRDTYTFEDVLGDPVAIQVCNYCRKDGVGGASVAVVTRQGGVDYDGPEQGIGSTSYDYRLQPYDTNPATSAQWTKAEMDAGEWGPLKVS